MELSNLIYKEDLNNGPTGPVEPTGPTGPSISSTGPTGAQGIIGPTGPAGESGPSANCFCVEQMRNVLEQLITLYPNDNVIIAMESGNNVSGRLGSILPTPNNNPNAGLLQLLNTQGVP